MKTDAARLEKRVIAAAMRMSAAWPDDVRNLKGNNGTLARLIRACKRLRKAQRK